MGRRKRLELTRMNTPAGPQRWRKKHRGKIHYFRGEYDVALKQWHELRAQLGNANLTENLATLTEMEAEYHRQHPQVDYSPFIQPMLSKGIKIASPKPTPTTSGKRPATLAVAVAKFLELKQNQVGQSITAGRWDTLHRGLGKFTTFMGDNSAVATLNEQHLADFHAHLLIQIRHKTYSPDYAHTILRTVKQFVRWAHRMRIIDLRPRNLDGRECDDLAIKIPVKAVATFKVAEVHKLLDNATPRTRLFILLALNCGMTQQDISDLHPSQVDLMAGTITRKRSKTRDCENAPVVRYKLWDKTARLLRIHNSGDPNHWLLTAQNNPLVKRELVNGKLSSRDEIGFAWRTWELADKPFKVLRKTSASMLADNRDFCSVSQLFLGHAPQTIAQRHYEDTPQQILDAGLEWLETVFLPSTTDH